MVKISNLPPDATPTSTDYVVVYDVETGSTKKVLLSNLLAANDLLGADGLVGIKKDNLTTDSNPYKFKVTTDNATTITSAYVKIQWGTEIFDTNNNFDNVNDQYTIPVDGFYQFNACLNITAGGTVGRHGVTLYKNGVNYAWGNLAYTAISVTSRRTLSVFDQFTAGDVISIYGYADGSNGTLVIDSSATWWSGYLVCRT